MSKGSNPIRISRRMLALALIAAGGAGVAAGELAAPLSASQAHAVSAQAPPACRAFAQNVAAALRTLGVVVAVEGRYASFIPKAYKDGETHNVSGYLSILTQLEALVKQVEAQDGAFKRSESALIATGKRCAG